MSEAVLRRMVRVFATGDLGEVESIVSPDYVDHQGLDGESLHGPEGFRRVVTAARSGWASLTVEIAELRVEDERVTARIRWHGVRPGGATVERETVDIVRVEDGRAIEHWGRGL